jgi:hypothetical protein
MNMHEKNQVQWQPIVEIIIVMMTILGSTIPLYLHTDGKIDAMRQETKQFSQAIHEEMKDFHGRLERQDAEFKSRLCSIEERNKK